MFISKKKKYAYYRNTDPALSCLLRPEPYCKCEQTDQMLITYFIILFFDGFCYLNMKIKKFKYYIISSVSGYCGPCTHVLRLPDDLHIGKFRENCLPNKSKSFRSRDEENPCFHLPLPRDFCCVAANGGDRCKKNKYKLRRSKIDEMWQMWHKVTKSSRLAPQSAERVDRRLF